MLPALAIAGVAAGYCVVHSLLATTTLKGWVRATVGARAYRWYRLAYNVFAGVSALPLLALLATLPDQPLWSFPGLTVYVALAVQLAALAAMGHSVLLVGAGDFLGLRAADPASARPAGALVTAGAYRYVRHPLYSLGLVLLWLNPAMTVNRLALTVVFTVYMVLGSYLEERRLEAEYGAAYVAYRERTPRLLPRLGAR